jgi:amino acid transporter
MAETTEPALRRDAVGLPGVLVQSFTHLAPAVSVLFSLPFIARLAGVRAPLAYLISFAIALMLGLAVAELAGALPSAGGYYTYVSRAVHPRAGWLTSWLYVLYSPILPAAALAFMGSVLESSLEAQYGIRVPWWLFVLGGAVVTAVANVRGIRISAGALLVFGLIEAGVVAVLAAWGFASPGPGGISLAPFDPVAGSSTNGIYLGVVFSILVYSGFEAAVPLAEESRAPRRNIPRAVVASILLMGAFMTLAAWGLMLGWGTDALPKLLTSRQFPPFVLAERYWGGAWVIVLVALLNSVLGIALACNNVATRMWYAMGRSGALPAFVAGVHPKYRTPVNAAFLQLALVLALGLGLGSLMGPLDAFLLLGLVVSLAAIFVYCAGNLAVMSLYRRELVTRFRPLRHLVLPIVSSAALVWAAYKSIDPLPAAPARYAPFVVGGWLIVGLGVLAVMRRTGREEWANDAGVALHEPEPAGAPVT